MSTAVAPRLDVKVAEARKLAALGLAGAAGLAKSRWIVIGITLAIVGFAVAVLVKDRDAVTGTLDKAPTDDEPLSKDDQAAIDAARGETGIPWEEAKKTLVSAGSGGKAST